MTTPLPPDNREYVSLFAGIGGFDIALDAAGWECHTSVEIDEHCNSVRRGWLGRGRYKRDVRRTSGTRFPGVGLVCGGFPCQDLSVAGKRAGLTGKRSGLFYEMVRIVDEARPRWLLWENVPGLLSSNDGADFWAVNAALAEVGYFGAWRVLDSQRFGVPQRRRRLFGLYAEGYSGACRAAAVLLEPEGGGWDPQASREAREGAAAAPAGGAGEIGCDGVAPAVTSNQARGAGGPAGDECQNLVPCLRGNPYDDSDAKYGGQKLVVAETVRAQHGLGGGLDRNLIAAAVTASQGHHGHSSPRGDGSDNLIPLYYSHDYNQDRVYSPDGVPPAHCASDNNQARNVLAPCLSTNNEPASGGYMRDRWMADCAAVTHTVRRLTPVECERIQGFPDGWTIPADRWTGRLHQKGLDSARYRACGNAVTTNVIYWIALRINLVEGLLTTESEVTP